MQGIHTFEQMLLGLLEEISHQASAADCLSGTARSLPGHFGFFKGSTRTLAAERSSPNACTSPAGHRARAASEDFRSTGMRTSLNQAFLMALEGCPVSTNLRWLLPALVQLSVRTVVRVNQASELPGLLADWSALPWAMSCGSSLHYCSVRLLARRSASSLAM